MQYELFYGGGGHEGPYPDLDAAERRSKALIKGSYSVNVVYIRERTAEGVGGYGKVVRTVNTMDVFRCWVCKEILPFDTPSGVCSSACLHRGQRMVNG